MTVIGGASQGSQTVTATCRSWCTICTLALRHLSEALPLLRRKFGASVIAVSGQLPPFNSDFEECNHFDFPVLSDKGGLLSPFTTEMASMCSPSQSCGPLQDHPVSHFKGGVLQLNQTWPDTAVVVSASISRANLHDARTPSQPRAWC